jgi:hypothetical protein
MKTVVLRTERQKPMTNNNKNIVIFVLMISLIFSVFLNVSKPEEAKGSPTSFDVSATVTSLKNLYSSLTNENVETIALNKLIKHSALLPDPVFTELMTEFRERDDNKIHYLNTKIYQFVENLQSNQILNKSYNFFGSGSNMQKTPNFIIFHGIKSIRLNINSTYKNNDYEIKLNLKSKSGFSKSFSKIKKSNGQMTFDLTLTPPVSFVGEFYIEIDPPSGTSVWTISLEDDI